MGRRHACPGGTVLGGAVQTRFETKSRFNWFKTFSNCFKLWSIRKILFHAQKIENIVLKLSKRGTTFSIEISSDLEWIWNENSEKFAQVENKKKFTG
jgi:hypothetical protein